MPDRESVPDEGYRALAEFRFQIRRFLAFSESAARSVNLEPQQHQLLLSIRGLPVDTRPTIRTLAARMLLKHHSMVELVDRLVERGLAERQRAMKDRREVLVKITRKGEQALRKLSIAHLAELRSAGPTLLTALSKLDTILNPRPPAKVP